MELYGADIDSGNGGSMEFKCGSLAEAWAEALGWAQEGDWPDEGCTVWLRVTNILDEDDSKEERIRIEPNHAALMAFAGANPDCEHEFTSEGEGGDKENPGVWSIGGTRMLYHTHCKHCGLRKEAITDSDMAPGHEESVKYTMPEEEVADE